MTVLWIVIAVVILVLLYIAYRFNRLIRLRTRTQEAWSEIDVELKRRHDLIPNLVETVKGYAAHERQVFDDVALARSNAVAAAQAGNPAVMAGAEDALSGTLGRLFAVAENYPQLKAAELFLNLQEQLTTTEDKVEFARRFYNGNARDLNTAIQTFPTSLFARMLGFTQFTFFQAAASDRAVPAAQFAPPPTT